MKVSRTLVRTSIILAAVITLSLQLAHAADWGKVSDEEWNTTAPAAYPAANALYLFANGEYLVTINGLEIRQHYRIIVLTAAGVDEAGNIDIWYDEDDKLVDFDAHTILPDGKKIKVDKKAIVEKATRGLKQRSIAFPAVDPGCILEYKYTVKSEYLGFPDPWFFQHSLYTLSSTLTLTHDDRFEYSFNARNVPNDRKTPTEKRTLDARSVASATNPSYLYTFAWEVENLMPLPEEPYQSCLNDYRSAMRFQLAGFHSAYFERNYLESWQKLGERYSEELDRLVDREGDIEKLARTLTAGLTDPAAQSRALYEHVIREYQTSEDLAWGGKISNLLDKKIGAGEDKNLLLVELHKALGLESWPVLIGTRDHGRFDPSRADLSQFNYLVAVVHADSSWEFLDAASQYYPYGILTPNCLTEGGFLLDGENSDLIRMTIRPAKSTRIDTTRMIINADNTASCSTTTVFSGYTASLYAERYDVRTPDEFAKEYYLNRLGAPCQLVRHSCSRDSLDQFIATVSMTSSDLIENLDGNLVVKPVSFTFRTNPFTSKTRFTPIDFIHPFQYRNVVEILPATAPGEYDLPPDTTFGITGATFTRHCSRAEGEAVVETELTVTKPLYNPSDYGLVRDFFAQVAQALNDEVALVAAPQ